MKSNKIKGAICGVIAAITYGTNPLGALNLYAEGVNPDSVLFYRYGLSVLILAGLMFFKRESFKISNKELSLVIILGVLFATSSLSLFISFKYLDAGVASSILFVYPVMVAVIMAFFFKEKVTITTILSILLSLAGISLLYQNDNGSTLSSIGVLLVMLSSLAYAIYIVTLNKFSIGFSPVKLTFYVMIFGTITIIVHSLFDKANHLQILSSASMWGWAFMLAILPTVISLVLMIIAVKEIGSTPTAIMGALEPVTAVAIGVVVFNEAFTVRLFWGILIILFSVMFIIVGKSLPLKIHKVMDHKNKMKSTHK